MTTTDPVVKNYSENLYSLSKTEDCVERVDDELSTLKKVLSENLDLSNFLEDSNIDFEGKRKALLDIFGAKVSPVTINFIDLLVSVKRLNFLGKIIENYSDLVKDAREVTICSVTTAIPLENKVFAKLEEKLRKIVNGDIFIQKQVDKKIIGGLVVRIGEKVVDASIKFQLDKLKANIISNIKKEATHGV